MPYVGKKPADIIATAVDTTTGTFSGDLTVDTNTLFVDSANNMVGVGTVSPNSSWSSANNFVISDTSSDGGMTILSGTSGNGNIMFADAQGGAFSDARGLITYLHASDALRFMTANTEAMRIDSSQNLLVGTTNSIPGAGNTAVGASIYNDGRIFLSKSANTVASFNRNTSDGAIAEFRKDGTTVGSIGTVSSRLHIENGDTGLRIAGDLDQIFPCGSGGSDRDAAIDLGSSGVRFKDLYLSTTAYATTLAGVNDTNTFIRFEGSDVMTFRTSNSERMRIDSSGNLLVGTTSINPADNNDASGSQLSSIGSIQTSVSNATPAIFNRGNDGGIVALLRAGVSVGTIGTNGTRFYLAGSGRGLAVDESAYSVLPVTTTGANSDGGVGLGSGSARFSNLYLSGGVYLGGTGSPNYLDDYEEGSYQPVITGGTSGSMTTGDSATYLLYTKIGNTVHVQGQIHITASTAVGTILVSLPFASMDTTDLSERSAGGGVIFDSSSGGVTFPTNTVDCCPYVTTGTSAFQFRVSISGAGAASLTDSHIGVNDRFAVSITYKTNL